MLIHSSLNRHDKKLENKLCLIHGKNRLTYREFVAKVEHVAIHLATRLKRGDRVLLKLKDPIAQLTYFFAIIKAGGSCIFIDAATADEVCWELITRHNIALYINKNFVLPSAAAEMLPAVQPPDIFLGALSSGSTGQPKLIWRDHISWTGAFAAQSKVFGLSGDDRLFIAGSLVYTANLNACLHMLWLGGTVVIAAGSKPRTWVQALTGHQANAVFMVPAHYKMLLKVCTQPMPWVKSVVACGAKIDLATVNELQACFPNAEIIEYYGASELGHVSYMTAADLRQRRPDAVGKPFPGVTVWLEEDVIWVRSPYLAPAYRPQATVGDLGRIDKDGYLHLLGRKQGLINSGGVKVIPEQVAAVLTECPGVSQAVVAGLADALRGERVCAWIVRSNPALTAAEILAFCRTRLRRPYCPQKLIFVEKLPLNSSGKIDLLRLKQLALRDLTS